VKSVLRNEPNPKPKGLEPPVPVFQRSWLLLYLLLAVAGAALVAAVTLLVSRHLRAKREAAQPPPPPVPAHLVALRRLKEIDIESTVGGGQFKELYLLLSEILRDYVGRRYGFDALEMTTTEINDTLGARAVPAETRRRFEVFFLDCDLVKFAKYLPDADGARKAFALAEGLVQDTALRDPVARSHGPAAGAGASHAPTDARSDAP
jgi:hypothetical protein